MGNSFRDLKVWEKAHEFVLEVYKLTKSFPKEEMYGVTAQLRRSAVSIPGNISEGFGRAGKKDKIRFYNIAEGSIQECHYYLLLTRELNYHDNETIVADLNRIGRMLKGYINKIKADI